jgi:PAS domain S-box-containing protein
MKPKYLMMFLICLLGFCLYLFYMIYAEAKENAITELNKMQRVHAGQAQRSIEFFFSDLMTYLTKISRSDHIIHLDEKGKNELDFSLNLYPDIITDITRMDASGKISFTTSHNQDLTGRDISGQSHVKKILETHQPVISNVFDAVQGYRAIALHVPVFKADEFWGTIGVLINFSAIPKRFLRNIHLGESGYAWMAGKDGIEIYCPLPEHTGQSVFKTSKDFPGLISMANRMVAGEEGVARYLFSRVKDGRLKTEKHHAVYLPVAIIDSFWTIVVVSSEDEVLAGLISLRNKLILVVCLLLFVTSLFSYSGMKAWGIVREAAKRKKVEEDLAESERKYRNIFENAVEGIFQSTPEGQFITVNPSFAKMFGYASPEELVNSVSDISTQYYVNPEDRTRYRQILLDKGYIEHFEFKARRKGGSHIWVSNSTRAYFDEAGKIIRYEGTVQDITARKQAEDALRESRQIIEGILQSVPVRVFWKDKNLVYLGCNSIFARDAGFSDPKDIIGKDDYQMSWQEQADLYRSDDREVIESGRPKFFIEEPQTTPSGNSITLLTSKAPLRDAKGEVIGVLGTYMDITERKQAEAERLISQKAADEHGKQALVGRIAGKMAHDFNNILGIIMGNTELSLIDCTDDRMKSTLELIYQQTIRGKNLTKNLVAFAKDQEPKQEFFPIDEKMDLVINLLKKDLEGVTVIREYGRGMPDLLADPGMVEHAMVNLIQNAIHATSLTPLPEIIIRTHYRDEMIFIEIEDNGCGIPPESLGDIFEPSFTLKGTRDTAGMYKPGIRGTGYGMSNVKKYIDQHKGCIEIHSELKKGTRVTISLPVTRKTLTEEEIKEVKKGTLCSGKYILLVEDEPAISDVQYRILTQDPLNHRVDIAGNGRIAMDLLDRNTYDAISLDYLLPGQVNGMDVYHHIRKTNKTVPVLFISGNIEFLESVKTLKQQDPHTDHLSKPCKHMDYINGINTLISTVAT